VSLNEGEEWDEFDRDIIVAEDVFKVPHFNPRPLRHLALTDDIPSMAPIVDMKVPPPCSRSLTPPP
jgi:hypothetical protein